MVFSEETIKEVWQRGKTVVGNDPNVWRKDECGAWILWDHYGNRDSQYGWDIDHIIPVSRGGGDDLSNLRPLQWENNAERQAGRLDCIITAWDAQNIRRAFKA